MGKSQDRALDELLAAARPASRYQDLAIWFRRLTVESAAPLPDDAELQAEDGTVLRIRNTPAGIVCGSNPPGQSRHLQDGALLRGPDGEAVLRIEVVARFGGRWDSLERRFTKEPPEAPLLFDLQESQVEITRAFVERFAAFKKGKRHKLNTLFAVDDRGGGKTLICLLLLLGAVLDHPKHSDGADVIAWIVSVNHGERLEIDREIKRWIPASWYTKREFPQHLLLLANGAVVSLISCDDTESTKQGRVDLFWVNEGAKLSSVPFENAIPRLKDRKGFCLIASNPPTVSRPCGAWVQELWEKYQEAQANGERCPIAFHRCSSKWNVTVDSETNTDVGLVLRWLNPERARADDEGLILPVGQYAYRPPFSPTEHVLEFDPAVWEPRDITRQITARLAGAPADWILGHDFQFNPGNACVPLKVYGTLEEPVVWVHSDFLVTGDEHDLISALEADLEWLTDNDLRGEPRFEAGNTINIGDPSGTWQDFLHAKGKDSFSAFRARKWRLLPPQPPKVPGNKPPHPPVQLRIARVNALLRAGRLFIAKGKTTERIVESLKKCQIKRSSLGRIRPVGEYTHLTDALGYAIWWLLPRFGTGGRRPIRAQSLGAGWRTQTPSRR